MKDRKKEVPNDENAVVNWYHFLVSRPFSRVNKIPWFLFVWKKNYFIFVCKSFEIWKRKKKIDSKFLWFVRKKIGKAYFVFWIDMFNCWNNCKYLLGIVSCFMWKINITNNIRLYFFNSFSLWLLAYEIYFANYSQVAGRILKMFDV